MEYTKMDLTPVITYLGFIVLIYFTAICWLAFWFFKKRRGESLEGRLRSAVHLFSFACLFSVFLFLIMVIYIFPDLWLFYIDFVDSEGKFPAIIQKSLDISKDFRLKYGPYFLGALVPVVVVLIGLGFWGIGTGQKNGRKPITVHPYVPPLIEIFSIVLIIATIIFSIIQAVLPVLALTNVHIVY